MIVVVSPYHVTTREAPFMAALMLATRVVTMMPAPRHGPRRASAEAAAGRLPGYLRLLRSWEWTVPLWEAGLLESSFEGHDPVEDVRSAAQRIARDERFAPLRSLMRPGLFDTDEDYLDSLATDLLKGGPDPAICVPVSAAMDRFATRHGLLPLRSEATSIAQLAEERLGARAFAVAVPVLVQSGAHRILRAREVLAEEVAALGTAVDRALAEPGNGRADDLARAARRYAEAFERSQDRIIAGPVERDDDERRVIAATMAITGVRLPSDAVLTSSVAAFRSTVGVVGARTGGASPQALAERDPLEGRTFVSLVVRAVGSRRA